MEKKPIKFEVHYHGAPVLVGERYDPKDLHAHLIYSDKEFVDVRSVDFTTNDNLITHTGQNSFYATYTVNGETFIDYFLVYGYTNKRYIDKDFQVFNIHDNLCEENVTDFCYPLFYNENLGKIYITLNNLYKNLYEGKFRFILPRDTGMCHKYSSEWIVIKTQDNVKVTLVKYYDEEEKTNG